MTLVKKEDIISHSIHIDYINNKELISIIHTEKGNTDRCFNTIILNFREEENHKIKVNFDYNRRFDLKSAYFAEPFYNPNMTPPTREERAAALKYILQ